MDLDNQLDELNDLAIWIVEDGDDDAGSDNGQLTELARHVSASDVEGWIEERLREALECLRDNWAAVTRVAQQLVADRVVTRDDLWWLLEG